MDNSIFNHHTHQLDKCWYCCINHPHYLDTQRFEPSVHPSPWKLKQLSSFKYFFSKDALFHFYGQFKWITWSYCSMTLCLMFSFWGKVTHTDHENLLTQFFIKNVQKIRYLLLLFTTSKITAASPSKQQTPKNASQSPKEWKILGGLVKCFLILAQWVHSLASVHGLVREWNWAAGLCSCCGKFWMECFLVVQMREVHCICGSGFPWAMHFTVKPRTSKSRHRLRICAGATVDNHKKICNFMHTMQWSQKVFSHNSNV